ncbi:uncharacterized protein LOC105665312 isoform X2 [Ceratitis capitata]|uniref:uncharacterized protein LOC105665312 isoform X2 n=1 Tax=Ceratitis capitata TaxID=7213 RepID=UPI000A10E6E7|nr:uncharacterized protein LOC105665312 isoform X2 [Ceratitis capitata]
MWNTTSPTLADYLSDIRVFLIQNGIIYILEGMFFEWQQLEWSVILIDRITRGWLIIVPFRHFGSTSTKLLFHSLNTVSVVR